MTLDQRIQRTDEQAQTLDDADLAIAVRDLLGGKLTCYFLDLPSTRSLTEWIDSRTQTTLTRRDRLRRAYVTASVLEDSGVPRRVVQAWFQGTNPHLEDRAPARAINESEPGPGLPSQFASSIGPMTVPKA